MNCDVIARHYAWIEFAAFGKALDERRRHFLPELASARRALVLGDGDGRFLRALLASNPHVQVDYIDLSEGMLQRAQGAAGNERVTYHRADALTIPLDPKAYDAIATHFFLDCFEPHDLARMIDRIRDAAAPGARWIVSEFRVPHGSLGAPARALIATMYTFFRLATGLRTRRLTDHRGLAESAGFTLSSESRRLRGLVSSELWVMTS